MTNTTTANHAESIKVIDIQAENANFADLGLPQTILQGVLDAGYKAPSPIQLATIPHVLRGTDVLGQAQTGTGKTAAFALPTLAKIDPQKKYPQVLVLAPTRELALQVAEAYKTYAKYLPEINILPIYGGSDYRTQLQGLRNGAQIVVGTPGRVMDHIERGTLQLDKLNTLILDEADEMLRMGFIDDVEWILSKAPEEKQITLFSATMPTQIKKITEKYLKNAEVVRIAAKTETAATIEQFYLGVMPKQKSTALCRVLEIEHTDATIIFVNTKVATEELAEMLNHRGYRAAALNGDVVQKQRERTIEQVKNGLTDIIIATDVAARGLDVERISLVINYDLPGDNESYVHRIGRTGRAGRTGKAVSILTPRDRRSLMLLERHIKQTIAPYPMPDLAEINAHRIAQFKARIISELEHRKLGYMEEILSQVQQESDLDPISMAAALASLVLGNMPLLLGKRDMVEVISLNSKISERGERSERRRERGERGERRERGEHRPRLDASEMQAYRLAVGRDDGVRPGHIVGAIANEAGIAGAHIGEIFIGDEFSEVFLPKGMPDNVLHRLQGARVMGKAMALTEIDEPTLRTRTRRRSERGDRNERGERGGDRQRLRRHSR